MTVIDPPSGQMPITTAGKGEGAPSKTLRKLVHSWCGRLFAGAQNRVLGIVVISPITLVLDGAATSGTTSLWALFQVRLTE
jgi:hypothetical protein